MPVPGMKISVEFGVGLRCARQRLHCGCKYFLLPLGFCHVSVFAQSCGGQNQHLFRNGVAGDSDWFGKKTRPDGCQRDEWCLVHTRMQAWSSRSRATGWSCLCFWHSWLPSRFGPLGNAGIAICLAGSEQGHWIRVMWLWQLRTSAYFLQVTSCLNS